jgi:hypothetical protein
LTATIVFLVLFIKTLRKNKRFHRENENKIIKEQTETISIENGVTNTTVDITMEENHEEPGTFSFYPHKNLFLYKRSFRFLTTLLLSSNHIIVSMNYKLKINISNSLTHMFCNV